MTGGGKLMAKKKKWERRLAEREQRLRYGITTPQEERAALQLKHSIRTVLNHKETK